MPAMRTCEVCHVELVGSQKRFCSHGCRDESMRSKVECKCQHCGKVFTKPTWETKRGGKYCSSECFHTAQIGTSRPARMRRELTTCAVCGKQYEHGGRLKRRRFCSSECRYAARYRRGMIAKQLSVEDAAYLSGFVDGEGSIMIAKKFNTITIRLSVINTNLSIMEWIKDTTGVGFIHTHIRDNDKHKDVHSWAINGDSAYSVITQLLPYLKVKRAQAELAIEAQERLRIPALKADHEWYLPYFERMKNLNQRGKVAQ